MKAAVRFDIIRIADVNAEDYKLQKRPSFTADLSQCRAEQSLRDYERQRSGHCKLEYDTEKTHY